MPRRYNFSIIQQRTYRFFYTFSAIFYCECFALKKKVYLCGMNVAIIGAGAAGCFCAIQLKRLVPSAQVTIFESGSKALAKVAITGGGRCNLTNTFQEISSLAEAYPRGLQAVKRAFCQFNHEATCRWFESEGVRLVTQPDQCIFPASQDAMQIVHTLLYNIEREGIQVILNHRVHCIEPASNPTNNTQGGFWVDGQYFNKVVVTTGGSPKVSGLQFLAPLNLPLVQPVPSLFSFNINSSIRQLMGLVIEQATTSLAGTKFKAYGPLLITHWGMSGPAILKLSSHAARHLAEANYKAQLIVNWMGTQTEDEVRQWLQQTLQQYGSRQLSNVHPTCIPNRLWLHLLEQCQLNPEQRWAETGKKGLNKLVAVLTSSTYSIEGQSRHKEEFVTCGGVSLSALNLNTLECKTHPGLYFAGEVLDIDAITGGFNLQAAWSTGYVVANAIANQNL